MAENLAKRRNNAQAGETSSATVGYEAQLWQMADALRGSMDAAECDVIKVDTSPTLAASDFVTTSTGSTP